MKLPDFILIPKGKAPKCARLVGLVHKFGQGRLPWTRCHLARALGSSSSSVDRWYLEARELGLLFRAQDGSLCSSKAAALEWEGWVAEGVQIVPRAVLALSRGCQKVWSAVRYQRTSFVPSVRSLAHDLQLAASTVQACLKRLESEGLLAALGRQAKALKRRTIWVLGRLATTRKLPECMRFQSYEPQNTHTHQNSFHCQTKADEPTLKRSRSRVLPVLNRRVQSLRDLLPSVLGPLLA